MRSSLCLAVSVVVSLAAARSQAQEHAAEPTSAPTGTPMPSAAPTPEPTPRPDPIPAPDSTAAPAATPGPESTAGPLLTGGDLPDPRDAPPLTPRPTGELQITGFQLGVRAAFGRALDTSSPDALSFQTPSILPIAIDLGYRTSTHVYVGLTGQLALASRNDCSGATGTCTAKDYRVGATVQYHFSPISTFDPWMGAGAGFELMHLSGFVNDSSGYLTRSGFILLDAQVGADFALTHAPRAPKLGPFLGLAIGSAESESGVEYTRNVDRSPSQTHEWFTLGVRATYDL